MAVHDIDTHDEIPQWQQQIIARLVHSDLNNPAWQTSIWHDPMVRDASPWWATLSDRMQQLVSRLEPTVTCRHAIASLATSESYNESLRADDISPCVTPGAKLWHFGRRRLLTAVEKAALQGIFLSAVEINRYDEKFASELAGDALCSLNFMSVLVATFSALATVAPKNFGSYTSLVQARLPTPRPDFVGS